MLPDKPRVSIVEYTNSLPFIWGIEATGFDKKIILTKDNPAVCAEKLITGQSDIGLVPVATLPFIPHAEIISDYCIGANGAVNSVFLFSNKPINKVAVIRLDLQSRTSNLLTQLLAKNYWKITPEFTKDDTVSADAFVEIGDRAFGKSEDFVYAYDLAEEWKNFTGLPFVFAVWVANKPIDAAFKATFNEALAYGIQHRADCIATLPVHNNFDVTDYLLNKISYELDEQKRKALQQFLAASAELPPVI